MLIRNVLCDDSVLIGKVKKISLHTKHAPGEKNDYVRGKVRDMLNKI